MPTLFDPFRLGPLALPNRVVMAPLTRNRSPGNVPTPLAIDYYAQRASAGLLITEGTAVSPQGQGYSDVPGLHTEVQLAAWKQVVDAVHAAGGRIVPQLWHVGRVSHVDLQEGGQRPVAPSAITAKTKTYLIAKDRSGGAMVETSAPRALDAAEIPGIVRDFAQAARRSVHTAGFDGVEIHGANGYLLDQFLKTGSNKRDDDYGGSIENRARLLLEVVRAVADEAGADRTGLRISPVTPANDVTDDDPQALFEHVMRELAPLGLAYIHVIEGATGGPREVEGRPFDYTRLKQVYRDAGGKAAWMVNNGYDAALADRALDDGADLVAFGRPYIGNPDLVERLRTGAPLATSDRATWYGGGAQGYTDYPTLSKS